jgi:DNA mismatch endonuclease, patch repair protein
VKKRVAIFCDGDFWHGRDLTLRFAKLSRGHNAQYWVAKIQRNVDRDRRQAQALKTAGWRVLRFWETDISSDVEQIAEHIAGVLAVARRADPKGRLA